MDVCASEKSVQGCLAECANDDNFSLSNKLTLWRRRRRRRW